MRTRSIRDGKTITLCRTKPGYMTVVYQSHESSSINSASSCSSSSVSSPPLALSLGSGSEEITTGCVGLAGFSGVDVANSARDDYKNYGNKKCESTIEAPFSDCPVEARANNDWFDSGIPRCVATCS